MTLHDLPQRRQSPFFFNLLEFDIALRYLRPARREGFVSIFSAISFLGFFIGVMVLVVVMAVMNGFRAELLDRFLGIQGHLELRTYKGESADFDSLRSLVSSHPEVTRVTHLMIETALFSAPGGKSVGLLRGIDPESLRAIAPIVDHLDSGSLETFSARGKGLVIGKELADDLGVRAGDTLTLTTDASLSTPFGSVPRTTSLPVIAVFASGSRSADRGYVYLPRLTVAELLGRHPDSGRLEIFMEDPEQVHDLVKDLMPIKPSNLYFRTWKERHSRLEAALALERRVMFLILSMIVVVAALNIVGSLIMLVLVKSRSIAILRTMGMERGSIMRLFMLIGVLVGIFGSLSGFAVGLLIAYNVGAIDTFFQQSLGINLLPEYYLRIETLPSVVLWSDNLRILLLALALSALSTLYPAWWASKTDPVEALRYG